MQGAWQQKSWRSVRRLALALLICPTSIYLASACGGSSKKDEEPEERSSLSKYPDLQQCASGLTDAEILDHIRIVDDYNRSLHELVACGSMTWKLFEAFQAVVAGLITGTPAEIPSGITYDPATSMYLVQPDGYSTPIMKIGFYAKVDSSLGATDELIEHDFFQTDNYLTDVKSPLEGISNPLEVTSANLEFGAAGPLVELLGFGAAPASPIELDSSVIFAPKKLAAKFSDLVAAKLLVDIKDTQSQTTKIDYQVESPPEAMLALFNSKNMSYEVKGVSGSRSELSQALANTKWTLEFVNGSPGALVGTVEFTVSGGKLPFSGYLTYQNTQWGKPTIYCSSTTRPTDPAPDSVRDVDVEPR